MKTNLPDNNKILFSEKSNKTLPIDKFLLSMTLLLNFLGMIFIYSANYIDGQEQSFFKGTFFKQILFFIIGLAIMSMMIIINYKKIADYYLILFAVCVGVLVYTSIFGKVVNNSKRWIDLGFFSIQPSEFVKIFMIIIIAHFLDKNRNKEQDLKTIFLLILLVAAPVFFIFLQPDLGTSLVFICILIVMMGMGEIKSKYFFSLLIIGFQSVVIPILLVYVDIREDISSGIFDLMFNHNFALYFFIFFIILSVTIFLINFYLRNLFLENIFFYSLVLSIGFLIAFVAQLYLLKTYQVERILAFLNPYIDRWGLGYNVIQSQITIGSGKLWGKGFLEGTQGQLGFLPARSTDFIFSIVGEEVGFVGSVGLVFLYLLFILRLLTLAKKVKDYLGGLIIVGITSMFTFQIFINIGMTIGVAPITGLPLPFFTSGGSTLLSSMMAMGLVFNIQMNRFVNS